MTSCKLNRFTMADAQLLAGKTADITAWDDDELETKVTYPGARVTGIVAGVTAARSPSSRSMARALPLSQLTSSWPGPGS